MKGMIREPQGTLAAQVKSMPKCEVNAHISALNLKTTPMDHQALSLLLGIAQDKFLFGLDPGLGKSKIGLDIYTVRKKLEGIKRLLIIAPPTVLAHWEDEIEKHTDINDYQIIEGTAEEQRWRFQNSNAEIIIVSHNWFSQYLKGFAKYKMDFDMAIIDEAHLIRNPDSVGFKSYSRILTQIPNIYLLTGTPMGNHKLGFWALYYMLDSGETFGKRYWGFRRQYFVDVSTNPRYPSFQPRKETSADFDEKIWNAMIRFEEKDCEDLPEKSYTKIVVEMTPEQEKKITKRMAGSYGDEDGRLVSDLLTICSGVGLTKSPKMMALCDIIKDHTNGPIIVWHWLRSEGDTIAKELKKKFKDKTIECHNGSMTKREKDEVLEAWHSNKIDILVCNIQSLSMGVNMYESSVAIYFSNTYSVVDRKQSEKRIHRKGQPKMCRYYDIVTKNGVDEVILRRLKQVEKDFDVTMRTSDIYEEMLAKRNK